MTKRYRHCMDLVVRESDDGEYVRYNDHATELATLRAENERLRGHVENLEAYALDIDRRIRGKGNKKWIPMHTEEVIHDIAWFNKETSHL